MSKTEKSILFFEQVVPNCPFSIDLSLPNKIDFTISNGVHNFKTNNNFDDFKKDLNFLFNISRIGFGISFLNNNVDYKENYLSYLSIKKVIDEIQKFNCSYIIDQTFKKYETFLIMHKK